MRWRAVARCGLEVKLSKYRSLTDKAAEIRVARSCSNLWIEARQYDMTRVKFGTPMLFS